MTSLLDTVLGMASHMAPPDVSFDEWQTVDDSGVIGLTYRPPVPNSEDLERVVALPRRPQIDLSTLSPTAQALVEIMNERLRRPDWQRRDCRCGEIAPERTVGGRRACITSLKPAQAWALWEAPQAGGLIGLLAVGSGKTSVGFLMPLVFEGCKQAVGLVPSNLIQQLVREYDLWQEHWRVPNLITDTHGDRFYKDGVPRPTLHIKSYAKLSRPESTTLLKSLNPDLVYADEMDKLANLSSARTARFVRAFAEVPQTKFCGWTGTAWDKSILECTHLAAFALKQNSPLPLDPQTAKSWALAIDPSDRPAARGALGKLCEPDEDLRQGFHRRLVETLGVVATREGAIDIPHNLYEREPPPLPAKLKEMLHEVRLFKRPDGEELVDAMEVAKVACEVALGFYYRWKFPHVPRKADGTPTDEARAAILLWFARRKAWRKELRQKLLNREEHLDSEKLCTDAAIRFHEGYEGELPVWESEHYLPWVEVKDSIYHETEAVWVDDCIAQDAANWAKEHRGIVWYDHVAFGERVAELSGLPMHGGGAGAEKRILAEKGDRSIIASIESHGRGRDGLQYLFNEQLVTSPPASGRMNEQLFARIHRVGQPKPEVNTWLYLHVEELRAAFESACDRAEFAADTWGAAQKLLTAIRNF